MALMRFDPFHELDRWTEQALASSRSVRTMPMEALRRSSDRFLVALGLPGVADEDLDVTVGRNVVTVERNVVTVRATRVPLALDIPPQLHDPVPGLRGAGADRPPRTRDHEVLG